MNEDNVWILFVGMSAGIVITAAIALTIGVIPKSKDLREDCEKDLARDKQCIMMYVKPTE